MGVRNTDPLPEEVEQLRRQLQEWRETRRKSEPLPSSIWDAAVPLAMRFGICRIGRTIGLDYSWLRKRVTDAKAQTVQATPTFLELPAGLVLTKPGVRPEGGKESCAPQGTGGVIELSTPDGTRMRMCLQGGAVDAAGMVAAFLGRPC